MVESGLALETVTVNVRLCPNPAGTVAGFGLMLMEGMAVATTSTVPEAFTLGSASAETVTVTALFGDGTFCGAT